MRHALLAVLSFAATVPVLLLPATQCAAEAPGTLVVVLDRGHAADRGAAADAGNALRIVEAAGARGLETLVLALGSNARGRSVTTNPEATAAGLEALGEDADYSFRGPSDARTALRRALAAHADGGRLTVVLLGPFDAMSPKARSPKGVSPKAVSPKAVSPEDDEGVKDLEHWNENAAADSRFLPIGLGAQALKSLAGARGLPKAGHLVLGMGKPEVTVTPFSPLPAEAPPPEALTARVQLLVDVLRLGGDGAPAAVVALSSDVAEDRIATKTLAGLHDFTIRRRQRDGRLATLTFKPAAADGIVWLCDTPEPVTYRWDRLRPDVLLLGPKGQAAPAFAAVDAEAGTPVVSAYRLRRSRTGPAPAWRVSYEGGTPPDGLEVEVGDEVQTSPEIAESEVRITFRAQPATPLEGKGTLVLSADGMEESLRVPYDVRVQPGAAALEIVARPQALPAAAADRNSTLHVVAKNGNVPTRVQLRAACETGHEEALSALVRGPDGDTSTWSLKEPFSIRVGVEHQLAFQFDSPAPTAWPWPCKIDIEMVPAPGLDAEGRGTISIRLRRPQLALIDPEFSFELVDGKLVMEKPIQLRLDGDGGDGDWLLALMQTEPTLKAEGDAISGWKAVGKGPGVWEIVPRGEWNGPTPKVFTDHEVRVGLTVNWPAGAAPGRLEVPVLITPRWGVKGYIFVGLAAAAVLLGLMILFQMRSVSVEGTLIYTVEGLDGTVGRLDLAPIGRRSTHVRADERGRLSLGKEGEIVARIWPTRVGGMLEHVDAKGHRERRLLVDGLSLRAGRHILRYMSGRAAEAAAAPEPVPDLLGEEYDIESGRVDALDKPADEPADEA